LYANTNKDNLNEEYKDYGINNSNNGNKSNVISKNNDEYITNIYSLKYIIYILFLIN
jgi:hypothetical protein